MKLFVFPSFSSRSGASMKKMFFLLLLFFPFLYAQNPHQVVKNIQGKGLTYREARIQAFRNAIEQTSVALESFSLSKNFEIVLDIIISSSQGIIVSYKLSKHYEKDGYYYAEFEEIVVASTQKTTQELQKIQTLIEGLKNLNLPSIAIQEKGDPVLLGYLQEYLLQSLGISPVSPDHCEFLLVPQLREDEGVLFISGEVRNRSGSIISAFGERSLLYLSTQPEDKKYAALYLLLTLLKEFILVFNVKISNIKSYQESSLLEKRIQALEVVTQCAFQFHQEGTSEYSIKTNGNLRQLLEALMKMECFDECSYKYDQPRRILELSYLSSSSTPAPSSSPAFEEGRLKRYQRNFQEAILALSLALKEMEPTHSDVASAYMLRGDCYFYLDELEKAIADYKEAIRFSPDSDIGLVSQGNLLFIQEQYVEAIQAYTQALEKNPKQANAYYYRGNAYELLGQEEIAQHDFQSAFRLNPLLKNRS
jgi:tetratricopeptide (TPR) repeat protein